MKYNWELPDWPDFSFQLNKIESMLYAFTLEAGEINGILKALPNDVQEEALLQTMIAEAIKTSEIEGEFLSRQDVMSSIRNNLGMNVPPDMIYDRKAAAIGSLMVKVRNSFRENLSEDRLWDWHTLLFSASKGINAGCWRSGDEPMQVISGRAGNEKVHFQAPPSSLVSLEMEQFIKWFNDTAPAGSREISSAPIRAAIAHLYFESIHPFEDGNGRIGRAIAEKALSQTLGWPVMLSLSETIESDKSSYYAALEHAQISNEISNWLSYFVSTTLTAQQKSKALVSFTLLKTKFFDRYLNQLNERQMKVINKMLETGFDGFKGGMTAKKYISIAKTSKATATRDLQELAEQGILVPAGAGRNVHYDLNINL